MNLMLLGPPGAGKGTLALGLVRSLDIPHISTGDIFRIAIQNESRLGLQVKEILAKGDLVPDNITCDLIEERLEQNDTKNGYILDGFPRTLGQAVALDKIANLDFVLSLELEESLNEQRLTGRLICSSCKSIYHKIFNKPKEASICDNCGLELKQRPDDKIEAVKHRLAVYNEQTKPLVEHYSKLKNLHRVDSSANPDEVLSLVLALIN